MFKHIDLPSSKLEVYELLIPTLQNLLEDTEDRVAVLANSSSLLKYFLKNVSWVGFYIYKNDHLVLGPFQGYPACTNIQIGKGVCGSSFLNKKTIIVRDVTKHENHIACDALTKSEIVLPIFINNEIFGVLDLDSYVISRFTATDQKYLEIISEIIGIALSKCTP